MKKFIALLALVLVSASTMMYAQESNAAIRRADRKAERDAERAKLRAEEQVQDMAAYQQAVHADNHRVPQDIQRMGGGEEILEVV